MGGLVASICLIAGKTKLVLKLNIWINYIWIENSVVEIIHRARLMS